MENPEELLQTLEEFSKSRPRDIPRELEDYLCSVAKTGDPIYQWPTIKTLFREKLINVITEFYETCSPAADIPACPNVELFNYDTMKTFILEKLDTFVAAPFTVQRICELLTSPRKEYNRIDKYMRALEKNILVVSTTEPGGNRHKNGDGIVNGIDSSDVHINDINVEEMDDVKEEVVAAVVVAEESAVTSLEVETSEAETKVSDEAVKDEDRIILTSTDSGIENISPESSTSSPENLNEVETLSSTSSEEEAAPKASSEVIVPEKKEEAEAVVEVEQKDSEVTSSEEKVVETTEVGDIAEEASSSSSSTSEEKVEVAKEAQMDVDSSSGDALVGEEEEVPEEPTSASDV